MKEEERVNMLVKLKALALLLLFMRLCIKAHEIVCVALRYLASGESFRSL